jgi:Beta-lactamase
MSILTPQATICPALGDPICGAQKTYNIQYGYGWEIFTRRSSGHRIIFHTGQADTFETVNFYSPKSDTIIIILSNLETASPAQLGLTLAQMIDPQT